MGALELTAFGDEHLGEASAVLARRHARHREAEPLLSPRFEQAEAARGELESAWRSDGASGAAALRGGRLVGFLVGVPRSGGSWGPSCWAETASHAAEDAETLRDLYAFAAARWVAGGATHHYVVAPATDPAPLEAWFRLGFGQQQGLGIREVPAEPTYEGPVTVRRATADDADDLMRVDILGEYQTGAPVFSSFTPPAPEEQRAEILEEVADDGAGLLIAHLDGRAVGCATAAPVDYSSLHAALARPDDACILGYAATVEEARGRGVGLALTEGVFGWAREHGYRTVVVDWRTTNLLSSRFWPARGFRTSFLRLFRNVA